jgi:hypothetical protein
MVGEERTYLTVNVVAHGRVMEQNGTQGCQKKQHQKPVGTQAQFHDDAETKERDAIEDEVANIAMTKNVGDQLPYPKLVAIGVEKIELKRFKPRIGQSDLCQAHEGHDDEQIF